jgi:uncharacterized OB-fold protein
MTRATAMHRMDEAAAAGQVALQHCGACGAAQYPPAELCHACLSDRLCWSVAAAAPGELLARAVMHHSFEPATELPRPVGLVRLQGGGTAVCFVAEGIQPGAVTVTATLDEAGRAVLSAC